MLSLRSDFFFLHHQHIGTYANVDDCCNVEKGYKKVSVRHHKYIWYGATVCDRSIFPAYHLLWLQYLLRGPRHYSANQMVLTRHWNMLQQTHTKSTQYSLRSFFVAKKITFPLKLDKDLANCEKNGTRNDATQKCNRGLTVFFMRQQT